MVRLTSGAPPSRPSSDGPRVNREITVRSVRLVNANGDMVGVVSTRDALLAAEQAGLDLVEISPQADPPVCKILDYGKFRYEAQKKAAEARKKQKVVELKEIKLRPTTDEHDLQVKLKSARGFLEDGHKVKFTIRFRGREMEHQELGMEMLNRVKGELETLTKVEQFPRLEGRQMAMILSPSK